MAANRRVRKGATDTLTAYFYDGGETPVDKGAVTVTVTNDAGTQLQTGSATNASGTYTFSLSTASTVAVDTLTVTWASATETLTTYVDVVGGFYFDLADLRAMPDLWNASAFPTESLRAARQWIEDIIDKTTNTSFVRRYRRDLLNSTGNASAGPINMDRNTQTLMQFTAGVDTGVYRAAVLSAPYVRNVLAIYVGGVALTAPQLAQLAVYPGGRIVRKDGASWGWGYQNIDVRYEGGWSDSCPADLREAALMAARYHLLSALGASGIMARATSVTNDLGTMQLTVAGQRRPTGIPDADAVILSYADQVRPPAVA